jgi:hypothetical protein
VTELGRLCVCACKLHITVFPSLALSLVWTGVGKGVICGGGGEVGGSGQMCVCVPMFHVYYVHVLCCMLGLC